MKRASVWLPATLLSLSAPSIAQSVVPETDTKPPLSHVAEEAQRQLQQTFTNLRFQDFGPAPIRGPIYQATAGGRLLYYAPESEHLIFAAVFDRNGTNLTALGEGDLVRRKIARIDLAQALTIGPDHAPEVIEFTDPDCPHCRALDRFWIAKAAEGKPVRRRIFFVTGIHPDAAAKAEHIVCSPDQEAAFKAIYAGAAPAKLATCAEGRRKVEADTALVGAMGIGGTPTLVADGQIIAGFRQSEIEAFLEAAGSKDQAKAPAGARR